MRIIIAGGGTGGHLFPALATARAVMAEAPDSAVLFVGTRAGIEARIIPETEFPIRFIKARGLRGTGLLNRIRGTFELPWAVVQSISAIRGFSPHVVLGVGGYASGPTVLAAVLMGVPTAIQEQNSVMGTTNRMLARFVDKVFVSWEDTEPAPRPEKTVLAGNPVREDIFLVGQASCLPKTDRQEAGPTEESLTSPPPGNAEDEGRSNVLIFGGSRGARSINRAMAENVDVLAPLASRLRIVHQTGKDEIESVRESYRKAGVQADVREFIHEMGTAYAWADLVVCRAGASSLAELTAVGKPAIVIPYPYATGDHQSRNADMLAKNDAVRVIKDSELANGALVTQIRELIEHRDVLDRMAEKSRGLGKRDAARTVARELLKLAKERS